MNEIEEFDKYLEEYMKDYFKQIEKRGVELFRQFIDKSEIIKQTSNRGELLKKQIKVKMNKESMEIYIDDESEEIKEILLKVENKLKKEFDLIDM